MPIGDWLFKQDIMKRIKYLREAQYWNKEKLIEVRNRNLNNLIMTAYNEVPLYRDLYDSAKVKPETIKKCEDLVCIPIVDKEILRNNYSNKTVRKTPFKTHENYTSGSTGKNFAVLEDTQTAGLNRAAFILMLEWAGWKLGEKHFQTGMTLNRKGLKKLKDMFLRCQYASAYDLRNENLDKYIEIIEKKKIRHIWGYPGSIYYLAKRAKELGWNVPMKSVMTWGDTLETKFRKTIEEAFKRKVNDAYGCGEGIQVACQCSEYGNYHIFSLDTIVEVVDEDGNPVKNGEIGNILLTRLHPGAMPLIRYKVGDLGILADNDCQCGRSFEVLQAIKGREVDEIVTPSGNKLIVHFFTGILEHFEEIDEFQIVQKKKDFLEIKIVPKKNIEENMKRKIIEALKEKGASDMYMEIKLVSEIPIASNGKRRFVLKDFQN